MIGRQPARRRVAVKQRRSDGPSQRYWRAAGPTPRPVVLPPSEPLEPVVLSMPWTPQGGWGRWPDGELRDSLGFDVYGHDRFGHSRFTGLTITGERVELTARLYARPFPRLRLAPSALTIRLLPERDRKEAEARREAFEELLAEGVIVRHGGGFLHVARTGRAGELEAKRLLEERVARVIAESRRWRLGALLG